MRRFRHLLWIIPSLIILAVSSLTLLARNALQRDRDYHQTLMETIEVRSNDFEHLEEMPIQFSCAGAGNSPHIEWTGGPEGTRSYALIATDWDAPSPSIRLLMVPHWILFDIPAGMREIPQAIGDEQLRAAGVVAGTVMGGTPGYLPPCPPLGRHQYQFRVYALDVDTIQPESSSRSDVLAAMQGHILGYGELIGYRTSG